MMFAFGIDVSNWQGVIDWNEANNTLIQFVYMNCSDGLWRGRPSGAPLSIADAFNFNVGRCLKPCGPYTFARPHNTDPEESARHSFECAGRMTLPHCLDLEDYDNKVFKSMSLDDIVSWSAVWLDTMERLEGRRPIIYNSAFFRGPGVMRYFPEYFWWLPSYTGNSKIDPNPFELRSPALNGNREPDMWQFTQHGRLPGIAGNVDKNLVLLERFLSLIDLEGDDMPSLDEIAALIKTATGSAIYHVNPHESERMKALAATYPGLIGPITPDTVPDLAFQVFPDFTMVQRTGEEVAKLMFIGVPDHGFRDDNWFSQLRLSSRDVA